MNSTTGFHPTLVKLETTRDERLRRRGPNARTRPATPKAIEEANAQRRSGILDRLLAVAAVRQQ